MVTNHWCIKVLDLIQEGPQYPVGTLSARTKKGRHQTLASKMLHFDCSFKCEVSALTEKKKIFFFLETDESNKKTERKRDKKQVRLNLYRKNPKNLDIRKFCSNHPKIQTRWLNPRVPIMQPKWPTV